MNKRLYLFILCISLFFVLFSAASAESWDSLTKTGSMELIYATEFSVDYYEGGYSLIQITDGRQYLVVPEQAEIPAGVPKEIIVLKQPFQRIYMVATSAMDLYGAVGGISKVRFSCLPESGWYVPAAAKAMADGEMIFAGKYNTPDYETLINEQCDLSVHSTMVYHVPEVAEMLEALDIPVFIERSSREKHPLGRMEWMKVHALILGCEDTAEEIYNRELERLEPILEQEPTGKKVAFFAVNDDRTVTVRKSNDYIAKTISFAGGNYLFDSLGEDSDAQTTITIDLETFYQAAQNADILICSSIMAAELSSKDELLQKSHVLADLSAFQDGNIWCTRKNLFQSSMGLGTFLAEVNSIVNGTAEDEMTYLYRLK